LTGTPPNGRRGATGVRTQVVTHMRMLPSSCRYDAWCGERTARPDTFGASTRAHGAQNPHFLQPAAPRHRRLANGRPMYLTIRVRRLRLCFRRGSSMLFTLPGPPFWVSLALLQAYLSTPVPASAGCPASFQRPLQVELSWPFANNDIVGRFCSFRLLQHAWCERPRAFLLSPHHAPGGRA
jgi:hypothetical protein